MLESRSEQELTPEHEFRRRRCVRIGFTFVHTSPESRRFLHKQPTLKFPYGKEDGGNRSSITERLNLGKLANLNFVLGRQVAKPALILHFGRSSPMDKSIKIG